MAMFSRLGPLPRAALTSTACMFAGDVACQAIMQRRKPIKQIKIDWGRAARFGFIGLTLHGPFFFKGFQLLDRALGTAPGLKTAITKSLVGQVTLFPTYTSLVLLYASLLEGQGLQAGCDKVVQRMPQLFVAGAVYWPLVNLINFMYVPAAQRVLAINVGALAWNSYLSYMNAAPVVSSAATSK